MGVYAKRLSWRGKVVSVDGCPISTRYNNMNRRRTKVLGTCQGRRKEGNRKGYWLCSVSNEIEDRKCSETGEEVRWVVRRRREGIEEELEKRV